jgi:hypothetical protein
MGASGAAIKRSPCFGYQCADQIFLRFLHKPNIFGHACSCSFHRFVKVLVLFCFPASSFSFCWAFDWPVHPAKQISPHVYTSKLRWYFPQRQNWQRKNLFHGTFTFHRYCFLLLGGHLWWGLNPNEFSTDGLFVQPEGFHVAFHPVLNFHGETCVIYHPAGGFRRSDQERLMEVSHGQLGVEDGVLVIG